MSLRNPTICFLTDYGLADPFVGVCHAVIAAIAPSARVVDITHGVEAGDVRQGAVVLVDALPWLPAGVHLAVVDPGVGTQRRGVIVAAGEGGDDRLLVGPDNGLLMPAAERLGGVTAAWELAQPADASATFHGRDLFAPAAAHLANGVEPDRLGGRLDPARLVRLRLPSAVVAAGSIAAEVLHVDRFGNLQLSASTAALADARLAVGGAVRVVSGARGVGALVSTTFADVAEGRVAVLADAWGRLQVAVNRGSAAALLSAETGAEVLIAAGRERGIGEDTPGPSIDT